MLRFVLRLWEWKRSPLFWRQYMTWNVLNFIQIIWSSGVCVKCIFPFVALDKGIKLFGIIKIIRIENFRDKKNLSFPLPREKKICIWITCFYHFFHNFLSCCWYLKGEGKKRKSGKGCAQEFKHFSMLSHANVSVQSNQSPPTYKFLSYIFAHCCCC